MGDFSWGEILIFGFIILGMFLLEISGKGTSENTRTRKVEVHEGYYDEMTAQGFNGYKPKNYSIEEKDGQIIITMTFSYAY